MRTICHAVMLTLLATGCHHDAPMKCVDLPFKAQPVDWAPCGCEPEFEDPWRQACEVDDSHKCDYGFQYGDSYQEIDPLHEGSTCVKNCLHNGKNDDSVCPPIEGRATHCNEYGLCEIPCDAGCPDGMFCYTGYMGDETPKCIHDFVSR